MLRRIAVLCAWWCVAAIAAAPAPADFTGTWSWEADARHLMLVRVQADEQGRLTGTMERPLRMSVSPAPQGMRVSDVSGPLSVNPFREVRRTDEGVVIASTGPDGARESVLRPDGQGGLVFVFFADGSADMTASLRRVTDDATVPTQWDASRSYFIRKPAEKPNQELAQLFAADQADRQGARADIDWPKLQERDAARRTRVRAMLDAGALRAADDYYAAAFIFQHGGKPADYLLAHVLAMASMALGRADAAWIASATLDRYLWSLEQPQVLGTQFAGAVGETLTQGNYDPALIPDSLRRVLGVPTRAQQDAQREQINRQLPAR